MLDRSRLPTKSQHFRRYIRALYADSDGQRENDVQVPWRVGRMLRAHVLEITSGHAQCRRHHRAASRRRRQGATDRASQPRRRATDRTRRKSRDVRGR